MKNSSINHFNQLEYSFGGVQLPIEGSFENSNPRNLFRFFQNRISTRNF